jgi:hypothetical protein
VDVADAPHAHWQVRRFVEMSDELEYIEDGRFADREIWPRFSRLVSGTGAG